MLLDKMTPELTAEIVEKALIEKGQRLPHHSLHRWWSRRFAILYRAILASYLTDSKELVRKSLDNPKAVEILARGKVFYEPFMGGGTGLIEAAIMGYHSIGIDINPVAVRIAKSTSNLLKGKVDAKEIESKGKTILRKTEEKLIETGWSWNVEGKIVSYIFVTRGKIPSWIDKYSRNGKPIRILRCPYCGTIFESARSSGKETCPHCGRSFEVTHKPKFRLGEGYPTQDGYTVWAVEVREQDGKKWRKRVLDAREILNWLQESHFKAMEKANKARKILDPVPLEDLMEGKRLKREGIKRFSQLFTTRQLATFVAFAEACRELELDEELIEVFSVFLSESAKSSSLVAKWHSPIGEPVPAVAMKTYWVPEYTVETNPLARVPEKLVPLARNALASSIRRAVRIASSELRISRNVAVEAKIDDARTFVPDKPIDIAIVDPPYMDTVRSYASLSIVHYGAMRVFDEIVGMSNDVVLDNVERNEIPRDRTGFGKAMKLVFSNIERVLTPSGRVVLFYNRKSVLDWENILQASVESGLHPSVSYWVIGEPPGRLARSRLRGVFVVVLTREKPAKSRIVFTEPLHRASEAIFLDKKVEKSAMKALSNAISRIYNNELEVVVL
ncbi:hypothetical protein E3E36_01310 [Thermococcus sp. M36]|uniref:hypothetical protein n=1 Tax=Thermococcus sp. M36 TaxID=1638261 RepID=UPI00143B6697|nr:hypothetical protein [Thermococcus sp. M36]NJE04810.1 hypothetical protein [Thermococcus sp. M36]